MEKIIKLIKEIKAEAIPQKKENMIMLLPECIQEILLEIKNCENIQDTDYYFSIIENAQCLVSIIISEDKIELPDTLWKLYKDFDRIDDKEWREYLFNKIKNGNYSLNGKPALYDPFPNKIL